MFRKTKSRLVPKIPLLLSFIGFTTILIIGGYQYYIYEKDQIRQGKYDDLNVIANLKINQITQWHEERMSEVQFFSENPNFIKNTRQLLNGQHVEASTNYFKSRLGHIVEKHAYANIMLIDPGKEILFSIGNKYAETDPRLNDFIDSVFMHRKNFNTGFFHCPFYEQIHLDLLAPVIDDNNQAIAVFVLRIDPDEYLYPVIQSWPTASKSSETLIIRDEGDSILFLNELRHWKNTALHLKISKTNQNLPAVAAVNGREGIFEGVDYRGIEVLSVIRNVPGLPWHMIAKVDKKEILSVLYFKTMVIIVVVVILFLLGAAGLAWIYSLRQRNIYRGLYNREKQLWESQEEFKTILYSIGDAVITTDTLGKIKQINPVAENLTGWSESDARGLDHEKVFRIKNEFTGKTPESPVKKVLREGNILGLANHTLLISKSGNELPIADSGAPIKNEQGKITGVILVFRDQSEEREAERKLKSSESILKKSQEIASIGSWVYDLKTNTLSWSDEVFKMFGLDRNKFEPDYQTFLEMIHPDDREAVDKTYQNSLEKVSDHYETEHRIIKNDTAEIAYVYEKCNHIKNSSGEIVRSIGIVQDITERKKAEEALRESEKRYRSLFESAPVGIFKTHSNGQVINVNPTMVKMLGCRSANEVLEHYTNLGNSLYVNPEKRNEFVSQLKKEKYVENFIYKALTINQKEIYLNMSARVAEEFGDGSFTIEGFVTDITKRREAEEQLIRQNKEYQSLNEEYMAQNEELNDSLELIKKANQELEIARDRAEESDRLKTAFLANMSHEVRTPMNAIIGFTNFMNEDLATEERKRYVGIINNNANHLLKIIDDVISISRLESEKIEAEMSSFGIASLFDEIYHSFLPELKNRNINFQYKIQPELKNTVIESDYQKLTQVLNGFISNSLKYTRDGEIILGCSRVADQLQFYVSDTGIGIPEKERSKIFDRFFRGEEAQKQAIGGTGLGLSIANSLVKLIRGKIEMKSEPGTGSTFSVKIPLIPGHENSKQIISKSPDGKEFKHLRVLIAEDEPANMDYLITLLENNVAYIGKATTGREVVEKVNENTYNLVLMDIKMPEMDGLRASKIIREKHPGIVIIAQTAYVQAEEKVRAFEMGCNDYLIKPIRKEELFKAILRFFPEKT